MSRSRRMATRAIGACAPILMTMFVLAGSKGAGAETSATPSEFAVKAAFLYRFSSFIEWPKAVSSRDSFEIGIVGDDPFGSAFKPFMSQPIEGRQLRITRDPLNADSAGPQILFVSSSEADRITQLLQQVADKPVLTVSDIDGFAARGGILNFVLRDKKIRFGINVEAADRAGPKLSSRLLKLAEIVTTASAGGDDQVDQGTGGER